ncbi:hypothetical protein [Pseudomonas nicosulfuronedens]
MKYFLILAVLTFSMQVQAEDFFRPCEEVIESPGYTSLAETFELGNVKAGYCQKLNANEFLYVTDVGNYDKFYHCAKTELRKLECREIDKYSIYPNINVEQRFRSKKGKQFVLFSVGKLSHGIYSTGYVLFHLVPKSEARSGYLIYSLREAGEHSGRYSDLGKVCSNLEEQDATTPDSPPYEFFDNGKDAAIIRFHQKITSCDSTNTEAKQTLEYKWVKGRFRLSKNTRIVE